MDNLNRGVCLKTIYPSLAMTHLTLTFIFHHCSSENLSYFVKCFRTIEDLTWRALLCWRAEILWKTFQENPFYGGAIAFGGISISLGGDFEVVDMPLKKRSSLITYKCFVDLDSINVKQVLYCQYWNNYLWNVDYFSISIKRLTNWVHNSSQRPTW